MSFLLVDKGRLFFTKLSFEARNSKFTKFSSSERLACFETQPSSEVYRILVDLVTVFFFFFYEQEVKKLKVEFKENTCTFLCMIFSFTVYKLS